MKIVKSKTRFIYLISPAKIDERTFYSNLEKIFKLKKVSFFQLRLKNQKMKKTLIIGGKIRKLCRKYKIKFLINDNPYIAKKINADGCHIGQKDVSFLKSRAILKNKIIGVTCHNSKKLITEAIKNKVDYIAIGAFFSSKTKKVKYKANLKLLKYVKNITKIPIVVIGGIKNTNYKKLLLNKANFLAISGYIWNNKKYKPYIALKKIK